jgi:RNA recognition motif-containing protein
MKSQRPISKRLFVGSLPYRFREGQLLSLFIEEGKIIDVRVIHNQWGRSRGMAYVEFENEEDAIRAKEKFNGYYLEDRSIIVDYSEPDPLSTPEGQANYRHASSKRTTKFSNSNFLPHPDSDSSDYNQSKKQSLRNSKQNNAPETTRLKYRPKKKVRQTIFESRNFGSRVGAKFARKTKKRNKTRK